MAILVPPRSSTGLLPCRSSSQSLSLNRRRRPSPSLSALKRASYSVHKNLVHGQVYNRLGLSVLQLHTSFNLSNVLFCFLLSPRSFPMFQSTNNLVVGRTTGEHGIKIMLWCGIKIDLYMRIGPIRERERPRFNEVYTEWRRETNTSWSLIPKSGGSLSVYPFAHAFSSIFCSQYLYTYNLQHVSRNNVVSSLCYERKKKKKQERKGILFLHYPFVNQC